MGSVNLTLSVSHDTPALIREVDALSPAVIAATRRAATQAANRMAEHAADTMRARAGGVYWDIHTTSAPTPDGARGTVRTPPSKPHPIDPVKGQYLRFEIDGRVVFTRHVDHPGSNPLDWITPLEARESEYEAIFAGEYSAVLGSRNALPTGI